MIKFIKATDLNNNPKQVGTFLLEHPYGDWLYGPDYLKPGMPIMFVYKDIPDKMMRSSPITKVDINMSKIILSTMNTVYYFEEVSDDKEVWDQ